MRLQEVLLNGDTRICSGCSCGWTSRYAFAYLQLLEREGLSPINVLDYQIWRALRRAEQLNDPTPPKDDGSCESCRQHSKSDYRENQRSLFRET